VSDISIANRLSATPAGYARPTAVSGDGTNGRAQIISGLQTIVVDRFIPS
jgi:hypothetical protein